MTEVKNCRIQPKKNIYTNHYSTKFSRPQNSSKQREHVIQRVLRKYYKLKTYSKPLHLILNQTFLTFLISFNDQSKYSKRCWNCTNERKGQKFACDSTKEGLIFSVREELNSVQRCQFRLLNKSLSSSRCKPEKTTRKTRVRIRGVFRRVEKRFPGPEKFTRKEPRKVYGPEKFSGLLRNARRSYRGLREMDPRSL